VFGTSPRRTSPRRNEVFGTSPRAPLRGHLSAQAPPRGPPEHAPGERLPSVHSPGHPSGTFEATDGAPPQGAATRHAARPSGYF